MKTPPTNDTTAVFFFNFGRSSQSMGRLTRACELFTKVCKPPLPPRVRDAAVG